MPQLVHVGRVRELHHANDRLHVVGDARAGDDPPSDDAEYPNAVRRQALVPFGRHDVGEVVLAFLSPLSTNCLRKIDECVLPPEDGKAEASSARPRAMSHCTAQATIRPNTVACGPPYSMLWPKQLAYDSQEFVILRKP